MGQLAANRFGTIHSRYDVRTTSRARYVSSRQAPSVAVVTGDDHESQSTPAERQRVAGSITRSVHRRGGDGRQTYVVDAESRIDRGPLRYAEREFVGIRRPNNHDHPSRVPTRRGARRRAIVGLSLAGLAQYECCVAAACDHRSMKQRRRRDCSNHHESPLKSRWRRTLHGSRAPPTHDFEPFVGDPRSEHRHRATSAARHPFATVRSDRVGGQATPHLAGSDNRRGHRARAPPACRRSAVDRRTSRVARWNAPCRRRR